MRHLLDLKVFTRVAMMHLNIALAIVVSAGLGFAGQSTVACAICAMVTAAYGLKAVQERRTEKASATSS